jgi:hypothetical protein
MKKLGFIGICLIAILAAVIGGYWRYMAEEGSVQSVSGLAVTEAERPCATDHYYVSLNGTELCVPQRYRPSFEFLDRKFDRRDQKSTFQNLVAVPVKWLSIPMSDEFMEYDEFLEPLKGIQLSVYPKQRDNFEHLMNRLATKKHDSEIATVTFDEGKIIGHYRAFVETFYSKEYLQESTPNTYYLRLEEADKSEQKPYIITCSSKINDRKLWGGDMNAEYWKYAEGRLCRSTYIEIDGGLVARILFYDRRRPVEGWHNFESALDELLASWKVPPDK